MNFGYNENGDRLSDHGEEEARVQPVNDRNHEKEAIDEDGGAQLQEQVSSSEDSNSVFSDDVELIIGETGNQSIDQPLVESARAGPHHDRRDGGADILRLEHETATSPTLLIGDRVATAAEARSFLDTVAAIPSRLRNVALVGALHHGKTELLSLLLRGKHYHQRKDELERGIGLKTHVITALQGGGALHPTSHLTTYIDTPGHPDLIEEAAAGVRIADAVLFCVDAVESLGEAGERLLRHVVLREQLPIILVLTKMDRLIMELKLPPLDAYRKLRLVIDAVNNIIASCGMPASLVSPENGTVCFTSSKLAFFFTLETFAHKYADVYPAILPSRLVPKLWGPHTFEKGAFTRTTKFTQRPTFVTLVLEPLYKIISHAAMGKGSEFLSPALNPLPRCPLTAVQEAIRKLCGDPSGEGIDALLGALPATSARAAWLRNRYEVGNLGKEEGGSVVAISPVQCVKGDGVVSVVRILSGHLRLPKLGAPPPSLVVVDDFASDANPWQEVKPTQMYLRTAEDGFVPVEEAHAGQVVYLAGFNPSRLGHHLILVGGPAAQELLDGQVEEEGLHGSSNGRWLEKAKVWPFACGTPHVHVSVELKDPAKVEQFQRGLHILMHTTPGLDVHKEETGEFLMTGYGELHLDTALHTLRRGLCRGLKVGLSQPFVSFSETLMDKEGALAVAGNRKATIGCTSGVLDRSLTQAIEYELIDFFPTEHSSVVKLWSTMRTVYRFDALDAQHIMALGPDRTKGPSLLIDDTLDEELPSPLTRQQKNAIAAGFRAVMAAGPLVGEVVRGVGVRLILAELDEATRYPLILSNSRVAVMQSLLGARPRLLEPVFSADILCDPESVEKVTEILRQRRGSVVGEEPIPATTLVRVKALVPAMDSFGLETQLRMLTHGQAFPFFSFSQWDVVPGDPYDATIHVPPLEPARGHQLARDFVMKTRFRKGLRMTLTADI